FGQLHNWSFRKLKISFVLSLMVFQVYSTTFAQRITFAAKETSLESVLKEIRKQAKVQIVYNSDLLKGTKPVSVDLKNSSIEPALRQVLAGTDLGFSVEDNMVLMRSRRKRAGSAAREAQQQFTASGIVADSLGNALSGVSIRESGTANATSSNDRGEFVLNVSSDKAELDFSFMGYRKVENISAGVDLRIVLHTDDTEIDEVVVVAYGTQKKSNLTGSVASVDMKALESRPVSQLGQALQGTVPGLNLNVSGLGGELGQTLATNIRGTGTIGQGSSAAPLILIDGMEGNMNNLNPEDIESISVLKDASSAAVYGSRAAFGVILITTKSGKEGKMTVSYNNNFRHSGPTNLPDQLDSWRFANYFNDASSNEGSAPIFNDETLERIQKYMAGEISTTTIPNGQQWHFHQQANDNVDWFREHFTSSWSKEHNVQLNGGSEKLRYYFS